MPSSPDDHVTRSQEREGHIPGPGHPQLGRGGLSSQFAAQRSPLGEQMLSEQPTSEMPAHRSFMPDQSGMLPAEYASTQPVPVISAAPAVPPQFPEYIPLTGGRLPVHIPISGPLPANLPMPTGPLSDQMPATTGQVTTGRMPAQRPGIVPLTSGQVSGYVPLITRKLPTGMSSMPSLQTTTEPLSSGAEHVTKKLATDGTNSTRPGTRPLTRIPATKERTPLVPPSLPPRRRPPIRFVGTIIGSVVILLATIIFVAPLNNNEQGQTTIAQTVSKYFLSTGSANTFDPLQHMAPPTPTPALLTTEGSCGGKDIWGTCATAVTDSGNMGTGDMQKPITGSTVTQVFANPEFQTWCNCVKPHSGIDLAASYGAPIMAADSGQVIWVGWDWSGLGWAVKINHGHYIGTIYGHLSRYIVKVGQNVNKGDVIAYEGSTGASTGPHLHFMVMVNNKWVNPVTYVQLP